jgi:glycosyltransferase involved in cell wall biosynthesis
MIINLFFVDYFNRNSSGLTTYRKQLYPYLQSSDIIKLHFIWVEAKEYPEFKKEINVNGEVHYYLNKDIFDPRENQDYDDNVALFLTSEASGKKNVVFHFNWINHAPLAQQLKQLINCQVVLTKHSIPWRDLVTNNYLAFYKLNKLLTYESRIFQVFPSLAYEQLAYVSVDHIICVTEFAKRALMQMFQATKDKITVIRNGLNSEETHSSNGIYLRKKYGFANEEKIILYAGAVNSRKGVFDLLVAFEKVADTNPSVKLLIAGEGDLQELTKRITRHHDKISVLGKLEKDALYNLYRIADVGVIPSYVEQCSYTAIEMMHFGLPLLVSDVDGLKEVVPDKCGLKFQVTLEKSAIRLDTDELRRKLIILLADDRRRKKIGACAKLHVAENYSASRMAAATIQIYETLTKLNGGIKQRYATKEDLPLVTVILPCYNAEVHLHECIESILVQTYENFELVIIDDGSIDGTVGVVKKYLDKRIVLVNNEINEGVINCLNQGIELAKGKFIARIDADDKMHRERLAKQVAFLQDKKNTDVGIVGSHHYIISESGKLITLKQYPVTDEEIKATLFFQNPFSHPSVMIRSNLLKKIRYPKRYKDVEDYALWFKICKQSRVANIPEYLTYCRIHAGSISKRNRSRLITNTIALLSRNLNELGVEHTVEDLELHTTITLGYGSQSFNSHSELSLVEGWIKRVASLISVRYDFSPQASENICDYVLQTCCNIYR